MQVVQRVPQQREEWKLLQSYALIPLVKILHITLVLQMHTFNGELR